jgi:hypothetical protein
VWTWEEWRGGRNEIWSPLRIINLLFFGYFRGFSFGRLSFVFLFS